MTECTQSQFEFPAVKRRKVQAEFSGGDVTSDGGVLLLREADRRLGLTRAIDQLIHDPRNPNLIEHSQLSLLRQRIYGIALGYEDLNDHGQLRLDPAIQTAVERDEVLASAPTLCRLENRSNRQVAVRIHEQLLDQFVASFAVAPESLILDFDATDDPVHGQQRGRFFHGYYDHYCFLPLYVFCKEQLLVSYLRPSNIDGAKHSWAILALLVKRLRRSWPKVKLTFRGDGGFCRHRMLSWCEKHRVQYIVGLSKNPRLTRLAKPFIEAAAKAFEETGDKQRLLTDIQYGAKSWNKVRRVLVKAEYQEKGPNTRYVVTNLEGDPQTLYDELYCARGEMENRIKEQQLGLFADRTSCHHWWPNQFRLLLSSLAYVLMEAIRRLALKGTDLAKAQMTTIRLKLFKIGAVILRNTRRVRFLLSSAYPYAELFIQTAIRLKPG